MGCNMCDFPRHLTNFCLDTAAHCSIPDLFRKFQLYGKPTFINHLRSTNLKAVRINKNPNTKFNSIVSNKLIYMKKNPNT